MAGDLIDLIEVVSFIRKTIFEFIRLFASIPLAFLAIFEDRDPLDEEDSYKG